MQRSSLLTSPASRPTRRVDCLSDQYFVLKVCSLCMIVGFVFGLPFFWLLLLLRNRKELHRKGPEGEPTLAAQNFDFLIGNYKPKFYLYEIAEMWRKVTAVTLTPLGLSFRAIIAAAPLHLNALCGCHRYAPTTQVTLTGLISVVAPGSMLQIIGESHTVHARARTTAQLVCLFSACKRYCPCPHDGLRVRAGVAQWQAPSALGSSPCTHAAGRLQLTTRTCSSLPPKWC